MTQHMATTRRGSSSPPLLTAAFALEMLFQSATMGANRYVRNPSADRRRKIIATYITESQPWHVEEIVFDHETEHAPHDSPDSI